MAVSLAAGTWLVSDDVGIVVPVGDANALAAGLKKLAENPALRQRMGATGCQQVLERHTWPASAEKLMGLYQRLCRTVDERPPRGIAATREDHITTDEHR